MRWTALVLVMGILACLVSAPACDSSSSTMPPPQSTDLTGTWAGDLALQSLQGITARMTWTLTQNNNAVAGSVLVSLPNGTVLLNGTLSGTLSGSTLTYVIVVSPGGIPSQPACAGQLGGTVTATLGVTSTLSGSYALTSATCTTPFSSGTFTLTKR
jgi:hypothetical protein